jgi:hypothetical protein
MQPSIPPSGNRVYFYLLGDVSSATLHSCEIPINGRQFHVLVNQLSDADVSPPVSQLNSNFSLWLKQPLPLRLTEIANDETLVDFTSGSGSVKNHSTVQSYCVALFSVSSIIPANLRGTGADPNDSVCVFGCDCQTVSANGPVTVQSCKQCIRQRFLHSKNFDNGFVVKPAPSILSALQSQIDSIRPAQEEQFSRVFFFIKVAEGSTVSKRFAEFLKVQEGNFASLQLDPTKSREAGIQNESLKMQSSLGEHWKKDESSRLRLFVMHDNQESPRIENGTFLSLSKSSSNVEFGSVIQIDRYRNDKNVYHICVLLARNTVITRGLLVRSNRTISPIVLSPVDSEFPKIVASSTQLFCTNYLKMRYLSDSSAFEQKSLDAEQRSEFLHLYMDSAFRAFSQDACPEICVAVVKTVNDAIDSLDRHGPLSDSFDTIVNDYMVPWMITDPKKPLFEVPNLDNLCKPVTASKMTISWPQSLFDVYNVIIKRQDFSGDPDQLSRQLRNFFRIMFYKAKNPTKSPNHSFFMGFSDLFYSKIGERDSAPFLKEFFEHEVLPQLKQFVTRFFTDWFLRQQSDNPQHILVTDIMDLFAYHPEAGKDKGIPNSCSSLFAKVCEYMGEDSSKHLGMTQKSQVLGSFFKNSSKNPKDYKTLTDQKNFDQLRELAKLKYFIQFKGSNPKPDKAKIENGDNDFLKVTKDSIVSELCKEFASCNLPEISEQRLFIDLCIHDVFDFQDRKNVDAGGGAVAAHQLGKKLLTIDPLDHHLLCQEIRSTCLNYCPNNCHLFIPNEFTISDPTPFLHLEVINFNALSVVLRLQNGSNSIQINFQVQGTGLKFSVSCTNFCTSLGSHGKLDLNFQLDSSKLLRAVSFQSGKVSAGAMASVYFESLLPGNYASVQVPTPIVDTIHNYRSELFEAYVAYRNIQEAKAHTRRYAFLSHFGQQHSDSLRYRLWARLDFDDFPSFDVDDAIKSDKDAIVFIQNWKKQGKCRSLCKMTFTCPRSKPRVRNVHYCFDIQDYLGSQCGGGGGGRGAGGRRGGGGGGGGGGGVCW